MASSIRCRLKGHDLDDCGICRRCGDESGAQHSWKDAEPERPCFKRKVCESCGKEKEIPDHDWEPADGDLKCSRCGLSI